MTGRHRAERASGVEVACLALAFAAAVALAWRASPALQALLFLASGGFERNKELVNDFIRGPLEAPIGATTNRGDGLPVPLGHTISSAYTTKRRCCRPCQAT